VGDVERVVGVDVAVGVEGEVVEDVGLEGVVGLHDEGVEVEPPEPVFLFLVGVPGEMGGSRLTIRH
jgi:hypothetical protein